jgi:hypothetical protein
VPVPLQGNTLPLPGACHAQSPTRLLGLPLCSARGNTPCACQVLVVLPCRHSKCPLRSLRFQLAGMLNASGRTMWTICALDTPLQLTRARIARPRIRDLCCLLRISRAFQSWCCRWTCVEGGATSSLSPRSLLPAQCTPVHLRNSCAPAVATWEVLLLVPKAHCVNCPPHRTHKLRLYLGVALVQRQGYVYRFCALLLAEASGRPVLPGADTPFLD